MRTFIIAAGIVASLFGAVAHADAATPTPTSSHHNRGRQLESPDRTVSRVRVTYVETVSRGYYVETNDGATYRLPACRYEDGTASQPFIVGCVWDAGTRGNLVGRSGADIRGVWVRIPAGVMARGRVTSGGAA